MNDHERVREARRWLYFAREDLDVAKELLRGGRIRHVCFYAQQSAEKALKAAHKRCVSLSKTSRKTRRIVSAWERGAPACPCQAGRSRPHASTSAKSLHPW